jgi:hypothetical protein
VARFAGFRKGGTQFSKANLLMNVASELGWFLLWHKIELSQEIGKVNLDRQTFRHMRQGQKMFVAGVDGCRAGWVSFAVEVPSLVSSVNVVDFAEVLSRRRNDLLCIAIDIPIGLPRGSRACDKAARRVLGQPRGSSGFYCPVSSGSVGDEPSGGGRHQLAGNGTRSESASMGCCAEDQAGG